MEIIEGGKSIEFIFIHCTINWFNATGLDACLILKTSGMYKKIKCVIFHIEGYWIVFLDTDGKAQRNKKESCCQPQLFFTERIMQLEQRRLVLIKVLSFLSFNTFFCCSVGSLLSSQPRILQLAFLLNFK